MLQIVGAGAVGTVLAGFLCAAGQSVRLVCRPTELQRLRAASHIRIDRVGGSPPLVAEKPLLADSIAASAEAPVLLCVKYPDLDGVLDALEGRLPAGATVVSFLNGVGAVKRIRERLPEMNAVAGSVLFNAQLLEAMHARVSTRPQVLLPEDCAVVAESLRASGIHVVRTHDEKLAWGKLLINLGNALGAVSYSSFHHLLTEPCLRRIYAAVIEEGGATLAACGIAYHLPLRLPAAGYGLLLRRGGALPWWLARWRNRLTEGSYPSMVSDLQNGRATEIDALNGEIVRLAEGAGLAVPVNSAICELVHAMEARRSYQPLTPAELYQRLPLKG